MLMRSETICSISTAPGQGAISIIRVSGHDAVKICNKIFKSHSGNKLLLQNAKKVVLFLKSLFPPIMLNAISSF